jgi:hypothetical protein
MFCVLAGGICTGYCFTWSGVVCGELWLTPSLLAETFGEGVNFLMGKKIVRFERVLVGYWGRHEYFEKLRDVNLDSEDLGN